MDNGTTNRKTENCPWTTMPERRTTSGSKLPALRGVSLTLSRGNLGEKLYQDSCSFNLSDPNCFLMKPSYNSLHDPNLRQFYHQEHRRDMLLQRNLITQDNKVICSLREYNRHRQYLTTIENDCYQECSKQQRELVKKLLKLKEEGVIEKSVSVSDLILSLLRETAQEFRKTRHHGPREPHRAEKVEWYKRNRQEDIQKYQDWISRQGYWIKQVEREVKREMNREKNLREFQARMDDKRRALLEKYAAQQKKVQDTMGQWQDAENLRKHRMFSDRITQESVQQRPVMSRRVSQYRLAPLPQKAKPAETKTSTKDQTFSKGRQMPGIGAAPSTQGNPRSSDAMRSGKVKGPGALSKTAAQEGARVASVKELYRDSEVKITDALRRCEETGLTSTFTKPTTAEEPQTCTHTHSDGRLQLPVIPGVLDSAATAAFQQLFMEFIQNGTDLHKSNRGSQEHSGHQLLSEQMAQCMLQRISQRISPLITDTEPGDRLGGEHHDSVKASIHTDQSERQAGKENMHSDQSEGEAGKAGIHSDQSEKQAGNTKAELDRSEMMLVTSALPDVSAQIITKLCTHPETSVKRSQTTLATIGNVFESAQAPLTNGSITAADVSGDLIENICDRTFGDVESVFDRGPKGTSNPVLRPVRSSSHISGSTAILTPPTNTLCQNAEVSSLKQTRDSSRDASVAAACSCVDETEEERPRALEATEDVISALVNTEEPVSSSIQSLRKDSTIGRDIMDVPADSGGTGIVFDPSEAGLTGPMVRDSGALVPSSRNGATLINSPEKTKALGHAAEQSLVSAETEAMSLEAKTFQRNVKHLKSNGAFRLSGSISLKKAKLSLSKILSFPSKPQLQAAVCRTKRVPSPDNAVHSTSASLETNSSRAVSLKTSQVLVEAVNTPTEGLRPTAKTNSLHEAPTATERITNPNQTNLNLHQAGTVHPESRDLLSKNFGLSLEPVETTAQPECLPSEHRAKASGEELSKKSKASIFIPTRLLVPLRPSRPPSGRSVRAKRRKRGSPDLHVPKSVDALTAAPCKTSEFKWSWKRFNLPLSEKPPKQQENSHLLSLDSLHDSETP